MNVRVCVFVFAFLLVSSHLEGGENRMRFLPQFLVSIRVDFLLVVWGWGRWEIELELELELELKLLLLGRFRK